MNYNASEVLHMAEQIERNGARYYRHAAEFIEDAASKKMLLGLASMEDDHEQTFEGMRDELAAANVEDMDPHGEAAAYMQMIADGQVFDVKSDPADLLTGKETLEQVLKLAISHEKDSIVFYEGVKSMVPMSLGKERVDAIIREEMKHIAILSRELKVLKST